MARRKRKRKRHLLFHRKRRAKRRSFFHKKRRSRNRSYVRKTVSYRSRDYDQSSSYVGAIIIGIIAAIVILSTLHDFLQKNFYPKYGAAFVNSFVLGCGVSFLIISLLLRFLIRRIKAQKIARREQAIGMAEIDEMDGHEFEWYVGKLFEDLGYNEVTVTKASGDQGVDIVATLGTTHFAVQCKRTRSDVGNKAVQEVSSGKNHYGCDEAAVITNAYYTNSAYDLAESNAVILWDRDDLREMIEDRLDGIRYSLDKDGIIVKSRK